MQYIDSTNELYTHKAINTQIRSRQDPGVKHQKKQPVPAGPIISNIKQHDKSHATVKSKARKTTKDDNPAQIQDIVALSPQRMQETITNNLINPDLKTLFDMNSNKEVITSIKEPDSGMLAKQRPILMTPEKVTVYQCHIKQQVEIDRALTELCIKVIRQLVVKFETADLIR